MRLLVAVVSCVVCCLLFQVRLQASSKEVPYTGIVHAVQTIVRADGVQGLWRGVVSTVQRAAVLTGAQVCPCAAVKRPLVRCACFANDDVAHRRLSVQTTTR